MSEPTRGQLMKAIDKVLDQAIANQQEINKQYEQLLMMTQAQAVVIKDIIAVSYTHLTLPTKRIV